MDKSVDIWSKVLKGAISMPFVKIDREVFLRKELQRYCDPEKLEEAIESPLKVLSQKQIEQIANGSIKFHLTLVTTKSALLGMPGGLGIPLALPADIAQFYGHTFALMQKLLYLYGWPNLLNEEEEIDDATAQILTLFTGVMMGSQQAGVVVKELTKSFAEQVVKRLPQQALTKYAIYNVAKQVAKWIGIKLTKETFAKGVSKAIPLLGGLASGGLSYVTFRSMAKKLKKHLISTAVSQY